MPAIVGENGLFAASSLRRVSPENFGPATCMPAALNCGANAVCRSGRRESISRMTLRGSVRAIEVPFVECLEGVVEAGGIALGRVL
jgi:hypothetical protein